MELDFKVMGKVVKPHCFRKHLSKLQGTSCSFDPACDPFDLRAPGRIGRYGGGLGDFVDLQRKFT
jgi:putative component of membrane protein insertase Oxa1/YidC/SpoIIIJ protein YidD